MFYIFSPSGAADGDRQQKKVSFKNINGEGKYFRGTEKDLDKFLDCNQLTLFDSEVDLILIVTSLFSVI